MSILIHNALIVSGESAPFEGWLRTEGECIHSMGAGAPPREALDADETVDARGDLLMPGAIDCHVHFREPGLTRKATIATESRAAVAGGVTSYIDMPNTVPQTVTLDAWHEKNEIAAATSAANYAFMLGATADNLGELLRAPADRMPAVKVFMGSSTGGMLLDSDRALAAVMSEQGFPVVVHAEDQAIIDRNIAALPPDTDLTDISLHSRLRSVEACVRATERALEMASRYGTRLHVAHLTTAAEASLFDPSPTPSGKQFTAEVSPHHLLWSTDDYPRLGARIKMNPAVKSPADREALRSALVAGRLDIIATDHAPHLPADKAGDVLHAASGAPMVQFSLPAMLDLFDPATVALRMAAAPAALFGIERRGLLRPGYYADLALVTRLTAPRTVSDADVLSLCGWTPMAGSTLSHAVRRTWVNGGNGPLPLSFKR